MAGNDRRDGLMPPADSIAWLSDDELRRRSAGVAEWPRRHTSPKGNEGKNKASPQTRIRVWIERNRNSPGSLQTWSREISPSFLAVD
jgi:hypothetical protein